MQQDLVDSTPVDYASSTYPTTALKPRVLIVDDEATVRLGCVVALRLDGWEAVGEESSQTALTMLADEHFDVLVLDYAMPELDGLALAAALGPLKRPPTLLASAYADGAVAFAALRLGIWDFLAKPLMPDELRRRVRRLYTRTQESADKSAWLSRTLYHCTRCAWPEALAVLRSCPEADRVEPADLVTGLLCQLAGDDTRAARAFHLARWWPEWNRQGVEMWNELAKRLG